MPANSMTFMKPHRGLPEIWYVLYAACATGVVLGFAGYEKPAELLFGIPIFVAMVMAIVTYFAVRNDVVTLKYVWLYRVLVGSLLLSTTTTFVASGSTMIMTARSPIGLVGLLSLGTFNLLLAILTWRALTIPTPRRAARAGALAVGLEIFAILPDVALDIHTGDGHIGSHIATGVALIAAFLSMATGGFACIASLVAFGTSVRDEALPAARVVD